MSFLHIPIKPLKQILLFFFHNSVVLSFSLIHLFLILSFSYLLIHCTILIYVVLNLFFCWLFIACIQFYLTLYVL